MKKIISEIYYIDFLTWYEKVRCPILFLPAENGGFLEERMRFIEVASTKLPRSKTVVIPNTTHLMMYDHEKELADTIQEFYAEIQVSVNSAE
jgi:2-succinyl-6-hydroxy-2,4-cyclohexadiene-1-carboxylate synthase